MSEQKKIRIHVDPGTIGCRREWTVDVDREDWEDMSETERYELVLEMLVARVLITGTKTLDLHRGGSPPAPSLSQKEDTMTDPLTALKAILNGEATNTRPQTLIGVPPALLGAAVEELTRLTAERDAALGRARELERSMQEACALWRSLGHPMLGAAALAQPAAPVNAHEGATVARVEDLPMYIRQQLDGWGESFQHGARWVLAHLEETLRAQPAAPAPAEVGLWEAVTAWAVAYDAYSDAESGSLAECEARDRFAEAEERLRALADAQAQAGGEGT